ncbi:hypothetical protein M0R45_008516 [Rubus argutus]|uniref:Uncharacterized protein n=1 Tax=Rubus argutus TaxID=59490 RepID=A0AAW1Y562_RUBAR
MNASRDGVEGRCGELGNKRRLGPSSGQTAAVGFAGFGLDGGSRWWCGAGDAAEIIDHGLVKWGDGDALIMAWVRDGTRRCWASDGSGEMGSTAVAAGGAALETRKSRWLGSGMYGVVGSSGFWAEEGDYR